MSNPAKALLTVFGSSGSFLFVFEVELSVLPLFETPLGFDLSFSSISLNFDCVSTGFAEPKMFDDAVPCPPISSNGLDLAASVNLRRSVGADCDVFADDWVGPSSERRHDSSC